MAELLLARGADRRNMTEVFLAAGLGDAERLSELLAEDSSEIDTPCDFLWRNTPLSVATYNGHHEALRVLLKAGSKAVTTADTAKLTPLMYATIHSIIRSGYEQTVQLLLEHGGAEAEHTLKQEGVSNEDAYAGAGSLHKNERYDESGNLVSEIMQMCHAYESHFDGHILDEQGCACVASWPGIYAKLFDQILAVGKEGSVSAAVVFLPEKTANYGKHASDKCYCEEIYGRGDIEWGCKWFEIWRGHVKKALSLGQRLQVYFFEGRVGQGKIESWEACHDDAIKRDSFRSRRGAFLSSLPESEKARLSGLSSAQRDDAAGERPGSERGDAEEALFMGSLSASDRAFLEGHKGLGNSQKAEVAWLEREGIRYEEVDVRDFDLV